MEDFTRESLIAEAEAAKSRPDAVAVAEAARAGRISCQVHPLSKGWIVRVGNEDFAFNKGDDIGRLLYTIYTSNLENADNIKRLRRLLDY